MRFTQYISILLASLVSVSYALTAKELASELSLNNVIKITDKNYERILNDRKDYSIVIFITASSARVNCVLCTEILPLFNTLASSYKTNWDALSDTSEAPNVFFGVADYLDNKKFFDKIALETVPKMYLFPPTEKKSTANVLNYDEFNFVPGDHYANIANFIVQQTKAPLSLFTIHEPVDYTKFLTRLSFVFLLITTLYKSYYKFDKVFKSTYLYRILSLSAIFSFTSGYMFNKIRQTPYSIEKQGVTTHIVPGHQQQLGAETQIVSLLYFALFLSCWFLIIKIDSIKSAKVKLVGVIGLSVLIFGLYSMLVDIYHIKNGGYPFYLTKLL